VAGHGRGCRPRLSLTHAGGTTAHSHLWQQLWTGRRNRFLRTAVWTAESNQRAPELLPLGTAALHWRHRDPARRPRTRSARAVRVSDCFRYPQQSLRLPLREPSDPFVQRFEVEPENGVVASKELALTVRHGTDTSSVVTRIQSSSNQGEFKTWRPQSALRKGRAVMWRRDSHVETNVQRRATAGCCERSDSD